MKLKGKISVLACLVLAVMTVNTARGNDILFTFTGTADSTDPWGYIQGQSYTFNVVISDGYTGTSSDRFESNYNSWFITSNTDPLLISSISGDGLTGTYQTPTDPYCSLDNSINNSDFSVYMDGDTGLTAFDGPPVYEFTFYYRLYDSVSFAFPQQFTNPASYFSNYTGTYSSGMGWVEMNVMDFLTSTFSLTEVSIQQVQVPEPATIALLAAGGIALLRRNKKLENRN